MGFAKEIILISAVLAACSHGQIIDGKLHMTIMAHYPQANAMFIRGNACGLSWDYSWQMRPSGTPMWKTDLMCPLNETRILEFKVLINNVDWMQGANAVAHIDPEHDTIHIYPWFYTQKGTLKVYKNIWSPQLNNSRDVIVYLPPSYLENPLKVHSNVLVMHDGNNLFDPETAFLGNSWLIQDTINPLIAQGQIEEVIVIGAYNTPDRMNEYTYSFDKSEGFGGKGDLYLDWIEETLMPWAQKELRIQVDHSKLGILGSSLGGLISCYAGWTRPSVYGRVGCMSSSFWWNDQDFQHKVLPSHEISLLDHPRFYMDSGTIGGEASCAQYTQEIEEYMESHGFTEDIDVQVYIDQGAEHNEYYWGRRFFRPMTFLYPQESSQISHSQKQEGFQSAN